jgi:type II secretory pathway predicted ATPase ExeA
VSDTPRTGKNRVRFSTLCHSEDAWWVHETVSAQLERELNEATQRIKQLEAKVDELHDLEKWLEGR